MHNDSINVLLVEDNAVDARLIEHWLAKTAPPADAGPALAMEHVGCLAVALERLQRNRVDVVLLDLMLPDSWGLDTFTRVRECAPHLPVVILVGRDDEPLALQALEHGAHEYLVKGCPDSLRLAIRSARERRQADAQRETRLRQQAAVARLGRLALGGCDFERLLDAAVGAVVEAMAVEFSTVLERQPDGAALRLRAGRGWAAGLVGSANVHAGLDSEADHALQTGQPVIVEDFAAETRFTASALLRDQGIVSGVSVLIRDGCTYGVLGAHSRRRRQFTEHDVHFLQAVANVLAEAMRRGAIEASLRENEERYRRLIENCYDLVCEISLDGRLLYVSPNYRHALGYDPAELIGTSAFDRMHPDDLPPVQAKLARESATAIYRVRHKDGSWRWFESAGRSYRTTAGEARAVVISRDITERKAAEEALRENELRFRQLAENIQEVFWMTDPAKQQMLYISPAYEKIWGRTCASLYQAPQTWLDAIHPEDEPRVRQAAFSRQASGEYDQTYRILRPDGTLRWIRDRAFPVRDMFGNVYRIAGVAQDITGQRLLEAQLRQAQKMESIGQLAAGVAHDFNNLLSVVLCHADVLLDTLPPDSEALEPLNQISQAATRAANLTRQLLLFSRKQEMQPKNVDLNEVIKLLTKMLRRILGEDIALHCDYAAAPPVVHADVGMIEQVIVNLAVNARDAMPQGGQLRVATRLVEVDAAQASRQPDARPGQHVCLSVADTGCGIPPEVLPSIFEPFFTTKGPGKGTGLGLATVLSIVKQHQGWIEVESRAGQGTTFRIHLPLAGPAPAPAAEALTLGQDLGGTETILLVEDDEGVRALATTVLRRQGYTVLAAPSGPRALALWAAAAAPIHLVLTDMVMPDGISGRELADKLRAEKPDLRVIYTTGYRAEPEGPGFLTRAGAHFLAKPYNARTLCQAVRACLQDARRPS
jgi:PAS domain S-box-containing protein